jgi:hypothetical protein
MATIEEQLRKLDEKRAQLKAKQAEKQARERKEALRKEDRGLLACARAFKIKFKNETDGAKRDKALALIRSTIDEAFPKENQADRKYAMDYIDHLAGVLEPLSVESEVTKQPEPIEPRQLEPTQESNPDGETQIESSGQKWAGVTGGG